MKKKAIFILKINYKFRSSGKTKNTGPAVIKQIFQTQEEKEQLIIVQTEDTTNFVLKREGKRNCEIIKSFTQTTTKIYKEIGAKIGVTIPFVNVSVGVHGRKRITETRVQTETNPTKT
jgi:hypothetical protein